VERHQQTLKYAKVVTRHHLATGASSDSAGGKLLGKHVADRCAGGILMQLW
jgi:hypothetical protein